MISSTAFIEQYPQLFDRVSRYVYFRVHHRADAEDIISSVILETYRTLHRINLTKGNVEQYALGIARYAVIDYWYKRKITYSLDEITEVFTHADTLQADERFDQRLAFDQLMDSLPSDIRALFALHYIDGLTYQEIADIVHKQPASIRKVFSVMHKKLRKQFAL